MNWPFLLVTSVRFRPISRIRHVLAVLAQNRGVFNLTASFWDRFRPRRCSCLAASRVNLKLPNIFCACGWNVQHLGALAHILCTVRWMSSNAGLSPPKEFEQSLGIEGRLSSRTTKVCQPPRLAAFLRFPKHVSPMMLQLGRWNLEKSCAVASTQFQAVDI